jgi:hypothetical protein
MTLQFSPMSLTRGSLNFTYTSDGHVDSLVGSQELVDVDNAAYDFFANGAIESGWGSYSYDLAQVSTTHAITATSSFQMQFSAGGYKVDGLRDGGGTAAEGIPYSSNYTYLVFYVYGGSATETMYVEFGGGPNGGFGNSNTANAINSVTVLPNQWNYFKIPISSLTWNTGPGTWATNSAQLLNTVGFFIYSNTVTEELYFDDIILVH